MDLRVQAEKGLSNAQQEELSRYITQFSYSLPDINPDERIDTFLFNTIFGTKKWRFNSKPQGAIRKDFLKRLSSWAVTGTPVPIVIFWGALKGDNSVDEATGPDLTEFFALRKLQTLQERAQSQYLPGMHFVIITEDIAEAVLHKDSDVLQHKTEAYFLGLSNLLSVLALKGFVVLKSESEILREKKILPIEFLRQAKKNSDILYGYWLASDQLTAKEREKLSEYQELITIGWKGTIPNALRAYYIKRVENQHTDLSEDGNILKVCEYLGICLARFQYDFFETTKGNTPALRIAFNPYPVSIDQSLKMRRIELKVNESHSNKSVNPWNGFTALRWSGSCPSFKVLTAKEYSRLSANNSTSIFLQGNGSEVRIMLRFL